MTAPGRSSLSRSSPSQTSSASCLAVSESFVFCGCADGVVRVFGPSNLQYVTTLHRPHRLGVDLAQSGYEYCKRRPKRAPTARGTTLIARSVPQKPATRQPRCSVPRHAGSDL